MNSRVAVLYRKRKFVNLVVCSALGIATLAALVPLFLVFGYTVSRGLPALDMAFFTELPKPVGESGGGMANAFVGTLTLVTIASAFGIPWGLATAIYLSEYGGRTLGNIVRFAIDVLASIPSIIIGLFVYSIVVLPMKRFSAIAGGIALGILIVPTVARQAEDLLKMIPDHIREAGLALGIPRYKVILRILLPGSLSGILTGIGLGIARVSGETAPLLFTAMNNRFWTKTLDQPISSLPVQIFTYAISPFEDWHRQAWAGALVLILVVFGMNLLVRIATMSRKV